MSLVTLRTYAHASIVREARRSKCRGCGMRRELYRIFLEAEASNDCTEAKCAKCWGLR